MIEEITREDLKKKIDQRDDFFLVETLAAHAYHHAHLPGAINIPPDQVSELTAARLPDKEAEIIVYCSGPT